MTDLLDKTGRHVKELRETIDRSQIEHVLKLYCRAIDRLDLQLLKSVYWPEATDNHGLFNGPASEFAEIIISSLKTQIVDGLHTVTHCTIEFDESGTKAWSEAYYDAVQLFEGAETVAAFFGPTYVEKCRRDGTLHGQHDYTCRGRYIDLLERRQGEWKILRREITNEWMTASPCTRIRTEGIVKAYTIPGVRGPTDPVFKNKLTPV